MCTGTYFLNHKAHYCTLAPPPTEFHSTASLLWVWLNICDGDTRGLHYNAVLGVWILYTTIRCIKYSYPFGLYFSLACNINWSLGFTFQNDLKISAYRWKASFCFPSWCRFFCLSMFGQKLFLSGCKNSGKLMFEGHDGSYLVSCVFSITFRSDRHLWSSLVCVNIHLH